VNVKIFICHIWQENNKEMVNSKQEQQSETVSVSTIATVRANFTHR